MADLDPLIRYRKHRVDEKKRALAALYAEMDKLEARKGQLLEGLERERILLQENETDLPIRMAFQNYARKVAAQLEETDQAIARLNVRIEAAQGDIREAFAEQKKIEIIHRRRQQAAQEALRHKEEAELDAIGIEGHRRREEKN